MKFSKYISQLQPSSTVSINALAQQKKAEGIRVFNLSVGEPLVNMPDVLAEAGIKAINEHKTKYPPVSGLTELKNKACEWANLSYNCNYSASETIVTSGGKFGIFTLLQTLLNPKDEVLIISPYWVSYPGIVEIFGGKSKIIRTLEEEDWKVTIDLLEESYTEKTKILILNNASNPTGTMYSKNELLEITKWAYEKDILIISDEVYSGLVYEGNYESCGQFTEYKEKIVVIQSCSKHFAMTGWRVGFTFASEEIIKKLTTLQSQSTSGAATVSQWIALAALENYKEILTNINKEMQKRRDFFIKTFNLYFQEEIKTPQSALYAFVPISKMTDKNITSIEFCEKTLEIGNVALVPGIAFGQEGYVRFSFGADEEELNGALQALYNAVQKF